MKSETIKLQNPEVGIWKVASRRFEWRCVTVFHFWLSNSEAQLLAFKIKSVDVWILPIAQFSNCCVRLFDFQIRNSMPCFQNLDFRIDISHSVAAPSSPAFVLYRVAAFRIALGSLRFSLFYVVSFRVVPRSFQVRCATALLFWCSDSKTMF